MKKKLGLALLMGTMAVGVYAPKVSAHEQKDLVGWVQKQKGKYIDLDGYAGAQCVDLVEAYFRQFWGYTSGGNAIEYAYNRLPSGVSRFNRTQMPNVTGNIQPGDVIVSHTAVDGGYGHVAIVTATSHYGVTIAEQNQVVDFVVGGPTAFRDISWASLEKIVVAIIRDNQGSQTSFGWQRQSDNTWVYLNSDGTYAKSTWKEDAYADETGRMKTNAWIKDAETGQWFYVKSDGRKVKNQWFGGYYFYEDGVMATNVWVYNTQTDALYRLDDNGYKIKNRFLDGKYLLADGKMAVKQWIQVQNKWYYAQADGSLKKNAWQGAYYLDRDGVMATAKWIKDGVTWYYVNSDGHFKQNTWQGAYYLQANGAMATSKWIKDGNDWYYVDANGRYKKSTWQGAYYLQDNGIMATTKWIKDGDDWYYVDQTGHYQHDTWVGDYYLLSDGRMARSQWIDDTYVDDSGLRQR